VPEPSEWLASIGELLDELGIDWAAIGALAANRYRATVRFTSDADALVEWVERLDDALRARGYDVQVIADEGEPPHLLRLRRQEEQVDLLPPVVEYQQVALDRAVDRVITAEDVIVFKLIAWRARDRDDIRSILETGRRLDRDYIVRWAEAWEVTDRWAEAQTWGAMADGD